MPTPSTDTGRRKRYHYCVWYCFWQTGRPGFRGRLSTRVEVSFPIIGLHEVSRNHVLWLGEHRGMRIRVNKRFQVEARKDVWVSLERLRWRLSTAFILFLT